MKDILVKVRYKLWGKDIQRALERAEDAGREVEKHALNGRIKDLENDIEAMKKREERDRLNFENELSKKESEHICAIEQAVNKRMSELDYTVNPLDVFTAAHNPESGKPMAVFLNGERLTAGQIVEFRNEASVLRQMRLWSVFHNTIKDQACKIMFTRSENYEDMRSGKMMLRNLDVLEKVLSTVEKIDLPKQ